MVCFRERIEAYQTVNAMGLNVHDHLKYMTIPELKRLQASESRNFEVALLNIEGDLNVSVMIRSACLMGAGRVHVIGRRKFDARGTVGSQNYIPVERIDALDNTRTSICVGTVFQYFYEKNLCPIFIEQGGLILGQDITNEKVRETVINITYISNQTPVLVMGNESTGIPSDLISFCKLKIANTMVLSIPQVGVMRSFNVSSAFAIACWEYTKIMGYNQ